MKPLQTIHAYHLLRVAMVALRTGVLLTTGLAIAMAVWGYWTGDVARQATSLWTAILLYEVAVPLIDTLRWKFTLRALDLLCEQFSQNPPTKGE